MFKGAHAGAVPLSVPHLNGKKWARTKAVLFVKILSKLLLANGPTHTRPPPLLLFSPLCHPISALSILRICNILNGVERCGEVREVTKIILCGVTPHPATNSLSQRMESSNFSPAARETSGRTYYEWTYLPEVRLYSKDGRGDSSNLWLD